MSDEASTTGEKVAQGVGGGTGAAAGAWLGAKIGIVLLGTGISGLVPGAIIGGYFAWREVQAFQRRRRRAMAHNVADQENAKE